jgi:hypothetical protein
VAGGYRAIFVDLDGQARIIATLIPHSAHLLDIGGGDGEPINRLLRIRPDLRVTTLDPAAVVGQWIEARFSAQVRRLSRTSLPEYLAAAERGPEPDVLLLADVMHHVPVPARAAFLAAIETLWRKAPGLRIIVKDVEPGHWRSRLGYWSDRYVTGDRGVSLVSREHLVQLLAGAFGPLQWRETELFAQDRPNYAMVFGKELSTVPSGM